MKKIITLLLLSTIFTASFAQRAREEDKDDEDRQSQEEQYNKRNNGIYNNGNNNQNSTLVVSSYSQNRFVINIDNNRDYQSNNNNGNGNMINVGLLQAGNHTVIINELRPGIFGNERPKQIYNSVLYFKPGIETNITINNNGQITITEHQFNNNGNGMGYGNGRKKKKHKRYACDDHPSSYPNNHPPSNPNNYPTAYPGNYRQMSDNDFATLKQYIKNEPFDDRKISLARQAASTANFSTTQVRELMNIFSFDDNKLDLAKSFFNSTVDRHNYYQLTDALVFGSNKDALLEYIKRR